MKAISVWNPWATQIALGGKEYETRSWPTKYRGPLAICSSKKTPGWATDAAFSEPAIRDFFANQGADIPSAHASGCVLAVTNIVDCIEITPEFIATLSPLEKASGDFTPGRYAWKLSGIVKLRTPLPITGRQGLFEVNGVCRICACTDMDCSGCIEKNGHPCRWVEPDLCSACVPSAE